MKQIVDKLNKIAKAIDSDVTISNRKLIIDSLDSITKAFGGTPNDSHLIVDKLDAIAEVAHGGGEEPSGTITITQNGSNIDVAQYRKANVFVLPAYGTVTVRNTSSENFAFVYISNGFTCTNAIVRSNNTTLQFEVPTNTSKNLKYFSFMFMESIDNSIEVLNGDLSVSEITYPTTIYGEYATGYILPVVAGDTVTVKNRLM